MYNTPNIQIDLVVHIPKKLNVMLDDESGSVEVEQLNGELTIDDQSGSVVVKNINNHVSIDNGSGDVTINSLQGEFKLMDDGSGTITVNGCKIRKC